MVESTYSQLKKKTKNIKNFDGQNMIFNEEIKYFNQDRFGNEVLNKNNNFFDIKNELPIMKNARTQSRRQERKYVEKAEHNFNTTGNKFFQNTNGFANSNMNNFPKYFYFLT